MSKLQSDPTQSAVFVNRSIFQSEKPRQYIVDK